MSAQRSRAIGASAIAFLALTEPAHAHVVQGGWPVFYHGAVHVLSTPTDLLAALGVGLLTGLRGKSAARSSILAFPLSWLAGGLLAGGLFGGRDPSGILLPLASAVSVTLCGLLAAIDLRLPDAEPACIARQPDGAVVALAASTDGQCVLSQSAFYLHAWDSSTRGERWRRSDVAPYCFALRPDDLAVIIGTSQGDLSLSDLP